ncbi:unnamed protein product [Closterium sp. NIES-53]
MGAEMASWKSTGTYVDEVPPPGANIVSGMWIFKVKRPPGSPPVTKARYVARGFSQREGVNFFQTFSPTLKMTTLHVLLHVAAQRDYELHSLDFSTAFLQGSLHEEIWLRRPPGFTGSFPPVTQWSLRRPVYGLRQAPHEWHDTLRTTLAALGFALSTADSSLFLRTDTSLPPFYVLVYVDDLVFATANTEALTLVKSELQKRHTCTDLGELSFSASVSPGPQHRPLLWLQVTRSQLHLSNESVEPSGPYPELVGCLMYLMTCTRPDLAYPLGLLARYVAPGRYRKVHMDAAKRVLRYLCSTLGMGLVLGGRGDVVLTVSWRSTRSSSVLGSSCEAEIYATAMAAQELRWLTYLLTDLEERPRSPPVLYQRGQLRLTYVATRANTADIFTKALPPGDHQHLCTLLGLVRTLPHLLLRGDVVIHPQLALHFLTGLVTLYRRQRPVSTNQTSAFARARTSPRPIFPQLDAPGSASTRDELSSSLDRPRPTLPRVVVPTFPERNRSQGQQKRNADADPPSPRHRMTKRQRKGITAKEKLHWLKMQDLQPDLSNRALAKLAKVQPCQIREWKKMRERLKVSSSCRRRLMGAGRKSKFPFMERAVHRQFLKHRGRGLAVSVSMLQKWSAKYMKHRMPGVNWRASFCWATRFRARWHLARRVKMKMGQKLAAGKCCAVVLLDCHLSAELTCLVALLADCKAKVESFWEFEREMRSLHDYPLDLILNANQTPLFLEMPAERVKE